MWALCRACNLTSFSPCLTGPVDYLFASCHKGPRFKSQGGYLCETGILLLALSRYIGDPAVIDHYGLVWGGPRLRRASSWTFSRPSCWQCDNPTWSHTAFLSRFHACCRSPFLLLGGEPCGEPAISLHSHHVSLVQWTTCLLPVTRDSGSNPQGGTYVKPGFSC